MSSPKRRRIHPPRLSEALLSEIQAEVEVDIGLKRQLSNTLESRIAWALMLQETIKKENGNATKDTLRTVALDALNLIEHSSDYILCQDPVPPTSVHTNRIPRPLSRKVQPLNVKSRASFLYIRSNALVNAEGNPENHLYLLKCPGCSRTAFTSLQGLLNHARLTHNLEWGTHDECIRACAVVDNDLDVNAGIEVGVGPAGVLPGLRTIFQNAVGDSVDSSNADKQAPSVVNHLVQTLGLHEDSPALAPFLGKDAIRRQIKIWDEDVEVDLETHDAPSKIRPWKMPFTPRNFDDSAVSQLSMNRLDSERDSGHSEIEMLKLQSKPSFGLKDTIVSNHSRFYFTTRVIITDRSLWIPVEQRHDEYQSYSHKWMISIDSPSYTYHITTVLRSLRVIPCDPSHSIPIPPTTSDPPFVVIGYSGKSFLARVELSFSGTGPELPEQKVILEHWVDLDPFNTREPVTGQEQVADIELDRNTVLEPRKFNYAPIGTRSLWDRRFEVKGALKSGTEDPKGDGDQNVSQFPEAIQSVLNDAVKQFPMTLNGGREKPPTLPYRLVSSPSHFRALVAGRQKAIEWSRARAIQEAYTRRALKFEDPSLMTLSVADVYSWLSENGHFLRERKTPTKRESSEISAVKQNKRPQDKEGSPHWCPVCGLDDDIHSKTAVSKIGHVESKDIKDSLRPLPGISSFLREHSCHIVPKSFQITKLPRIDVSQARSEDFQLEDDKRSASLSIQDSPSAVDPPFTLAIHGLVERLGLSTFRCLPGTAQALEQVSYPVEQYGQDRSDVERNLISVQILALLTKQLIRTLVRKGLEIADRDKAIASGLSMTVTPQRGNRREAANRSKITRVMTPTHILSGILTCGRGRGNVQHGVDNALLLSLSKLGAGAQPAVTSRSRQADAHTIVKMED